MTEATIILVHGLWMTGAEMIILKRRLRGCGFRVLSFRYRMVKNSLDHNTVRLEQFVRRHAGAKLHLVGHSLGGVLALQALQRFADLPVDKVICLGSPLIDSVAGRRLGRSGTGRRLLGRTLPEAIFEQPLGQWSGSQAVGVLAGTRGFGIGKLITKLPRPNDGVVTLAETCLPGISDHMALPVSHSGLVVSRVAAQQCAWFLRHGQFRR